MPNLLFSTQAGLTPRKPNQYPPAFLAATASSAATARHSSAAPGPNWSLLREVDFSGALPDWAERRTTYDVVHGNAALDLERALAYAG